MEWLKKFLRRFRGAENGATMVEYGLLLALVIIVCISVIQLLGLKIVQLYDVQGLP